MGMSGCLYNWKRFWCPREGSFSLGDSGYLTDPESKWGRDLQPQVVAFDKIQTIPCLLLLGEPGIGKSSAMESEQDSIVPYAATEQAQFLWRDLRSYGDETRLCQALFEDPIFLDWKHGDHHLHLFLDSLDECLLQIGTLSALLIEEFRKHPVDRLSLRIACRTADLPLSLEKGLAELWPNNLGVYELTPLRKRDVREAGLAPFQWTVSRLSFSTRDSRRCGNCGSRVAASKRLWESRSDFHGLVSFHNS